MSSVTARFLDDGQGRIFAILRRPRVPTGAAVLIAPPFAEEMNKARRMLTEVGLALQARGIATVLPDLYGTGDSEGEFRDATWAKWVRDFARAAAWAAEEGCPVAGLLCVRLGCILGAQVAREALPPLQRTVFWQPVIDGDRFVTQFLRLRVAASMMEATRETVSGLRQALLEGRSVEIAGYEVSPGLIAELGRLRLAEFLGPRLGALHWIEVTGDPQAATAAASENCLGVARSLGLQVSARTVVGEPFWSSIEIVRIPELLDATVDALADIGGRRSGTGGAPQAGSRP